MNKLHANEFCCAALRRGFPALGTHRTIVRGHRRPFGIAQQDRLHHSWAPLSEVLIDRFGWRQTNLLLGVTVLVVLNAPASFVVWDPETLGLQPDGDLQPAADVTPPCMDVEPSWALSEAIHSRTMAPMPASSQRCWATSSAACTPGRSPASAALSSERVPLRYGTVEWNAEVISRSFHDHTWDV
jgi:hypothetical protein